MVSLQDVMARSDVVFVTVPATPETKGLIGRKALSLLKEGAYLINVARAGVVDMGALAETLGDGRLGGAAIDAWDEVGVGQPLFAGFDNVILSPHRAGTHRDFSPHLAAVVDNLVRYAETGEVANRVDLQAGY